MRDLQRRARVVLALCVAALVAGALALLALTDIWHGEQDTALEWLMVQIAAPVMLVALLASVHFLRRVLAVATPQNDSSPLTSPSEQRS
jgi:hypothetical protein